MLMTTWKRGREIVSGILRESSLPMDLFLSDIARRQPARVPGTAVFMTSDPAGVPVVLLHHLKHNKVLHQTVVIMSIEGDEVPQVAPEERLDRRGPGRRVLQGRRAIRLHGDAATCRRCWRWPRPTGSGPGRRRPASTWAARHCCRTVRPGSPGWRKMLFIVMARNAQSATAFFNLPPNRVLELGAQIQV